MNNKRKMKKKYFIIILKKKKKENLMEKLQDMVNQKVQDAVKKF
jgi:hypothetical protein